MLGLIVFIFIPLAVVSFAFNPVPLRADSVLHGSASRNIVVISHNVSQTVADGIFEINNLLHHRVDVLARCVNSALWASNAIRKDTTIFLMLFPHNLTIEIQGSLVRELNPDERTTALCLQRTLLEGKTHRYHDGRDALDAVAASDDERTAARRREVELTRLQATNRQKPRSVNPYKPGALPKSERLALRTARKAREATVRRINRLGGGTNSTPLGFSLHRNDALEKRLEEISAGGEPILMLNEFGVPLWDVVEREMRDDDNVLAERDASSTTLILGDQIGYSASDEALLVDRSDVRQVSLGPLSLLTSQCITIAHHYLDRSSI